MCLLRNGAGAWLVLVKIINLNIFKMQEAQSIEKKIQKANFIVKWLPHRKISNKHVRRKDLKTCWAHWTSNIINTS